MKQRLFLLKIEISKTLQQQKISLNQFIILFLFIQHLLNKLLTNVKLLHNVLYHLNVLNY